MASTLPRIDAGSPSASQANGDTSVPSTPHTPLLTGMGPVAATAPSEAVPPPPFQSSGGGSLDFRERPASGVLHDPSSADDGSEDEKIRERLDGSARSGSSRAPDDPSAPPAPPGVISPRALIRSGSGAYAPAVGKVQASSGRRPGLEGVLVGGALGFVVGAAAVAVTFATGGIGLVVAGALLAGATGAGAFGGGAGSALAGNQQQKTHLDETLENLDRNGVRFSQDEADRLAAITDSQWRSLLQVPGAYVADPQKQRKHLVRAVARHGYKLVSRLRAFAKELCQLTPEQARRLDRITDAERRALLEVSPTQVPDKDARRALRQHLVFNVGRHGYQRTMAEKPALLRMIEAGARWPVPVDLDSLRRSVRGPAGATLYGPYDFDLEQVAAHELRTGLTTDFVPARGPGGVALDFAEQCRVDAPRFSRMALIAADSACMQMRDGLTQGQSDAANQKNLAQMAGTLAAYVGDRDGDQAAVVKNLSAYLVQGPLIAINQPAQGLFPVAARADQPSHVITRSQEKRGHWVKIDVQESAERGSYQLTYRARAPIRRITSIVDSGRQEAHGHWEVSMSIRVRRADLAAGNRAFEWDQRPRYDLELNMGPSPRGRLQIWSRPNDRR
jgi:hypothetical protein